MSNAAQARARPAVRLRPRARRPGVGSAGAGHVGTGDRGRGPGWRGATAASPHEGSSPRADPAVLADTPFSDWRVPGVLLAGLVAAVFRRPGGGNGAATGMPASCR